MIVGVHFPPSWPARSHVVIVTARRRFLISGSGLPFATNRVRVRVNAGACASLRPRVRAACVRHYENSRLCRVVSWTSSHVASHAPRLMLSTLRSRPSHAQAHTQPRFTPRGASKSVLGRRQSRALEEGAAAADGRMITCSSFAASTARTPFRSVPSALRSLSPRRSSP